MRDSWGGGLEFRNWSAISWVSGSTLPVRGLIGYHPKPRFRSITVNGTDVTLAWDGPSSTIYDDISGTMTPVHFYQLEKSPTLDAADFQPFGPVTSERALTIPDFASNSAYYRVRLLP